MFAEEYFEWGVEKVGGCVYKASREVWTVEIPDADCQRIAGTWAEQICGVKIDDEQWVFYLDREPE